ncbi:hypothetical protein [Acetobacter senegalensis]|uniref:hypothetical protein n=1 Tax=Acetobacter senegalensis TaxID=446692 RepID=UPI00073E4123|nr:hypothetical protein [Acetobacter senegalensis]
MKSHNPTRTPAAPACQPDVVRGAALNSIAKDGQCGIGSNSTWASALGTGSGLMRITRGYCVPEVSLNMPNGLKMGSMSSGGAITAAYAISFSMCGSLAGRSFTADGVCYRKLFPELLPVEMSNQDQLSLGLGSFGARSCIYQCMAAHIVPCFSGQLSLRKPALHIGCTSQYSFSESSFHVFPHHMMDVAGGGSNATACNAAECH